MSHYMSSVFNLLEARKLGMVSGSQFLMKASRCILSDLTDQHLIMLDPAPNSVEDTAMTMNKLLVLDSKKNILAYDIGYLDGFTYGLVATWSSDTCIKSWRSNGCVRWGLESSVASVSGQGNRLIILDTTTFEVAKVYDIHEVSNIFVHSHNPHQLGIVAVGCDSETVPIIDLRIPHTNYVQQRSSTEPIICLEWSPYRENQFLTSTTNQICLWDTRSPKSIVLSKFEHGKTYTKSARFLDAEHVVAFTHADLIQILDFSKGDISIRGSIESVLLENFNKPFKFVINTFSKPNLLYVPSFNRIKVIELEPPFNTIITLPSVINVRILEFNSGTNELFAFSNYSAEVLCPKYYWQHDYDC